MIKPGNSIENTSGRLPGRRFVVWVGVLFFTLLAPAFQLYAQQLGGINGTVTDISGAVIPGAKITATDSSTGVVYRSVTSSAGTFLLVNVNPASYTVTVEAPGFEKFVQNDFRVDTGTTASVLASLHPGASSDTIEVSGAATPLMTEQPDVGTTIEPELWNALPLEVNGGGRDFRAAALSNVPGVQDYAYGYGKIGGAQTGAEFNYFNGLPQNSNATMLPPYDFINEVHVDVTSVDAELGWGVGSLQFQTKFGTNALHGSAFEINRNSLFDSRGLGNPAVPPDHQNDFGFSVGGPVLLPKIYNGRSRTFFYFSFERFMQNNSATGFSPTGYTTVPTAAMKQGDFTGFMTIDQSGKTVQAPIYDPLSLDPYHPQQFQSNGVRNMIPSARISQTAHSLLSFLPDPNTTGTGPGNLTDNYYYNVSIPEILNRWGLSIDEHITPNHSINVAMDLSRVTQYADYMNPPIFGGISNTTNPLSGLFSQSWPGGFVYGNYVWSIHSNLIFTTGVSIPFDYSFIRKGLEPNTTIAAQSLAGAPAQGFPTIGFSGINAPRGFGKGSGMVGENMKTPYYAGYANIGWTKGRHTMNYGTQGMYYKSYGFNCGNCAGTFQFNGTTTSNNISTTANAFTGNPYAGSPFASFMIGQADNAWLAYSPTTSETYGAYALYVQDAFKATPKLTLNAGLRWDIQVPYSNSNDQQDFVTPASLKIANGAASGQPGALTRYGTCAVCAGVHRAAIHWGEMGPRLGLSYALNHETVLSGGFSVLWQQYTNNNGNFQNDGSAFGVSNYINSNGTNNPGFGNWDSQKLSFPAPAQFNPEALAGQGVGFFDPSQSGRNSYYLLWNAGVQRTLPHNFFVRTTYIGQRGLHLVQGQMNMNPIPEGAPQQYGALLQQNINSAGAVASGVRAPFANFSQLMRGNATVGQALKSYPQYTSIANRFPYTGSITYNSLQMELDKRYTGGLSLLSGFTLQQDVGNATSMLGWDGQTEFPVDPYHPSTINSPIGPWWMANIAGTYDLPVGPGKAWFNNSRLTGQIIGGWKLAWTQYYGSGSPHAVTANGSPYGYGNRANRVSSVPIKTHPFADVKKWILAGATGPYPVIIENNGAFTDTGQGLAPGAGQWIPGNSHSSNGELRDPTYMVENLGAMKQFSIMERATAILRVDYFNPFNRWYIGNCTDYNIDSGTFGKVINPRCGSGQRQGQVTFRLEF